MEKMTNEQIMEKIEGLIGGYHGNFDELFQVVGMVVLGRFFGWRVMRLVASNRAWKLACDSFGDLKEILPEKGEYYDKSRGMRIVDKAGQYWNYIKRLKSIPIEDRKFIE